MPRVISALQLAYYFISQLTFDFQIGHVQYLSTLIKDNRKFFRKKFGTQFLLDVIRVHYGSCPALSKDDSKTIRGALFGLVKFYLQKDVSSKDVLPIVNFILSVKQEGSLLSFGSSKGP